MIKLRKSLSYGLIASSLLVVSLGGSANAAQFDELSAYFEQANTVSEPKIVDCTLSGGTQTTCFQVSVKPVPTTHTPGPWCPGHISDSADEGGIWLESDEVHDVDGAFIENMATFYSDSKWQLFDEDSGDVRVTDTYDKCAGAAKPDVDPEYQQHCVECQLAYLEDDTFITYTIPLTPVVADQSSETRRVGSGVAFDGIRLDAPAPVSDILSNYTVAPFDDCGGHVNLAVGYHYHAATDCLEQAAAVTNHGNIVGLAMDGYLIHARLLSDGTAPSDLDQCQGHKTEDTAYHYHAGEQGSNAILSCLKAEYGCVSSDNGGECDASASSRGEGPGGQRPDFAAASKKLGVSENELMRALGGPPPNFEKAAATLGVSADEIQKALGGR